MISDLQIDCGGLVLCLLYIFIWIKILHNFTTEI